MIDLAKNAKGEKQNPVLGFLCEPCVSARDKFVFLGELYESQKGIRYFSY